MGTSKQDQVIFKYNGPGYITSVPARDLVAADLAEIEEREGPELIESLVGSRIYEAADGGRWGGEWVKARLAALEAEVAALEAHETVDAYARRRVARLLDRAAALEEMTAGGKGQAQMASSAASQAEDEEG